MSNVNILAAAYGQIPVQTVFDLKYPQIISNLENSNFKEKIDTIIKKFLNEHKNDPDFSYLKLWFRAKISQQINMQQNFLESSSNKSAVFKKIKNLKFAIKCLNNYAKKILLQRLHENITDKDSVFIDMILKNPRLEDLLFDKKRMIKELQEGVYDRFPVPPANVDYKKLESNVTPQKDLVFLNKLLPQYIDRPPLEKLPRLQLLRLCLLKRALENKNFLEDVGKTAVSDIMNRKTELGGKLYLNNDSDLIIKQVRSTNTSDNYSYAAFSYRELYKNSVISWHGHMIELQWHAFPSSGDLLLCHDLNGPSLILSTVGYFKDENGGENLNKIKVNFIFCFCDKTNPKKPVIRIVNLGDREVPIGNIKPYGGINHADKKDLIWVDEFLNLMYSETPENIKKKLPVFLAKYRKKLSHKKYGEMLENIKTWADEEIARRSSKLSDPAVKRQWEKLKIVQFAVNSEFLAVFKDKYFKITGICCFKNKVYDEAITNLNEAIKLNPNDHEAYRYLGLSYRDAKDYDSAIASFTRGLALKPKNAHSFYIHLGETYIKKEQYDKALEVLNKADQSNPYTHFLKGQSYFYNNNYGYAIISLTKALDLKSGNTELVSDIYELLGESYEEKELQDKAVASYEKSLEFNPNNQESRKKLDALNKRLNLSPPPDPLAP